jgi:hypothetical protein
MTHHKTRINPMLLVIFTLPVCLFLLTACPHATNLNYDEHRINSILYDVNKAFNDHDIDALMIPFHQNYLHSGMALWEVRELWLDRMARYQLMDLQNVNITVNNDKAIVTFTMKLQSSTETVYTDEPATHGDLSYFWNDGNDWYVYGNQLLYRP